MSFWNLDFVALIGDLFTANMDMRKDYSEQSLCTYEYCFKTNLEKCKTNLHLFYKVGIPVAVSTLQHRTSHFTVK